MAERCLLVDDSEAFLAAAVRRLESEGLEVVGCATHAEQALELVEAVRPDIVLVDVELGDEDGVELSERIRELAEAPKVILISAYDKEEIAELTKPAKVEYLPKNRLSAAAIAELTS